MKLLIISDIHGNWPALQAVLQAEPDVDEIQCLGDLVNYGPQPAECVAWAMQRLRPEWIVQGNHDRAFGRDEDPHCSPDYQPLAEAVQAATSPLLTPEMKRFLAGLQPLQRFQLGQAVFVACHATPSDPLCYLPENSPVTLWESELYVAGHPDFLLLGHTHEPMKTRFRRTLVVNPGSVGQPKHGDPQAAYAVWEDGEVALRRVAYDVEQTIRAYDGLNLDRHVVELLSEVLRTGGYLPLLDQTPEELWAAFHRKHPDKLEAMFYLQKLLNRRIGVDTDHMDDDKRQQWMLNYCRAMSQEVAELTDCMPWKWWASYQSFDKQNARVEIADLLHFLISLAQVLEVTPEDLFDLYTKKHRLNLSRQESGYTAKDERDNRHL